MKVLGILGSPRRGGNSEILLKAFLEGAAGGGAEVEEILLRELKISPCLEIYHCFKDGTCPIKDDMRELYDKLLAADVVALASPIFFYNVSAQAKAMIDRTQALWARRYVLKQDFPGGRRQGILLAVGATKGKLLFVGTRLTAKYFFDAVATCATPPQSWCGALMKKAPSRPNRRPWSGPWDLGRRLAQGEQLGPIKMDPLAV